MNHSWLRRDSTETFLKGH
uniref:Uncharacterized protein n=1 Tax=Anguilla anguilla TaxID=7936 RepID=A0A0E9SU23_ANGAN